MFGHAMVYVTFAATLRGSQYQTQQGVLRAVLGGVFASCFAGCFAGCSASDSSDLRNISGHNSRGILTVVVDYR